VPIAAADQNDEDRSVAMVKSAAHLAATCLHWVMSGDLGLHELCLVVSHEADIDTLMGILL
jgi:hypothetical protein